MHVPLPEELVGRLREYKREEVPEEMAAPRRKQDAQPAPENLAAQQARVSLRATHQSDLCKACQWL